MHLSQNLLSCITIVCVVFSGTDSDDFDTARREVALRKIGHEILLQSGDSTSRVLPVQKIGKMNTRSHLRRSSLFKPPPW
jgi:hypothetical protein